MKLKFHFLFVNFRGDYGNLITRHGPKLVIYNRGRKSVSNLLNLLIPMLSRLGIGQIR